MKKGFFKYVTTIMFREKCLLSVLLVAVLVLGLSLGVYTRQMLYHASGQQVHMDIEYRVLPIVKIEVTRGGEVIKEYSQVDPPTNNFAKLLEVIFHPCNEYYVFVTDLGGSSMKMGKYVSKYYSFTATAPSKLRIEVRLGNGTSPLFSRSAYTLQSEITSVAVADPSLSVNETHSVLSLTASWTAPYNVDITEVGLSMAFERYDTTDNYYSTTLLFYTPLEETISLLENDVITITYQFVFPEPFTVQIAKLFYIIFLPYSVNSVPVNATDGSVVSIGIADNDGYDFFCTGDHKYLEVAVGNGSASWDPWRYSLTNQVFTNNATISVTQGDQGTYVTITTTIGFSVNMNVTEVGLVIQGEVFDSTNNIYVNLLLAYFALDQSIQVEAGQSLEITIKLVFP